MSVTAGARLPFTVVVVPTSTHQRLERTLRMGSRIILAAVTPALLLGVAPTSTHERETDTTQCNSGNTDNFELRSTIALTRTRDGNGEIYLIDPDGSDLPRRLTTNTAGDGFPNLSPDGKKIVFDSNRNYAVPALNVTDLFVMNADGTDQRFLVHGTSATWSPDCRNIAFHASASGTGTPVVDDPGSATTDSDLFVANVDDLLKGVDEPVNVTNSVDKIDDDADWSPLGQTIVYAAYDVVRDPPEPDFLTAEIYVINADGSGTPTRLTNNDRSERAPAWSPDGTRIAYMCQSADGSIDVEICVMNANGTNQIELTENTRFDGGPNWSPDGSQIMFVRSLGSGIGQQLFVMDADGSDETQLTFPPGSNTLAQWGELRVHVRS